MAAFYNENFRRAAAVFGSMFNNIEVRAIDRSNAHSTRDISKVRLTHGPREKVLERALQGGRSSSDGDVAMNLPAMSFTHSIDGVDETRRIPSNRRISGPMIGTDSRLNTRVPVPYRVTFELSVMTRHIDELLQITEQILPRFQMGRTIYVKKFFNTEGSEVSDELFSENMTFVLRSVSNEYEYEGQVGARQVNTAVFQFETAVNMYGTYNTSKIIKKSNINYYSYSGDSNESQLVGTINVDGTNIETEEEYEQLLLDDGLNIQIVEY